MSDAQVLSRWECVKADLRAELGDATFSSWIAPICVIAIEGDTVVLGAPTKYVRDRVNADYGEHIESAWRLHEPDITHVRYQVGGRKSRESTRSKSAASSGVRERPTAAANEPESAAPRRSDAVAIEAERAGDREAALDSVPLNPRFRFDRYVVGRPNEFAFTAAKRVAEDPETPFNPLFLYGPSGLGKTHLLHSIAWRRAELFPNDKLLFISSETFLLQFMASLRRRTTYAFKEVLRSVDMLIIDDVQHIMGKDYTQEEFFHTFNALADQHRQIVLSADCSPQNLEGLDNRLRSRLGWGLVADLHPTDYELRRGILDAKSEEAMARTPGLEVDPKVLDFLAHRISADVRTLEGALNVLFAKASMAHRPASIEMAQRELGSLLRQTDRKVTIDEIQRKVAEHYNMRLADMFSPRRARSVARPRQVAMYLSKQLTNKSLPEIGSKFGGRDHTTVMHAVKRVEELRAIDSAFDDDVERLRRMLEG